MVEFCARKADNEDMTRDHETPAGKGRGWMRLAAAASTLGVSEHTVRRWSDAGVLPSYRSPGGQRRFRRADIERQLTASAGGVAGAGRSEPRRAAPQPPRSRDAWLRALLDASRAVATAETLEDALRMVAQFTAEALGSPECLICEYDEPRDALIPRALFEAAPTGWDRLGELLPLDEHPAERRIIESGESLEERLSDPDLTPASRVALEAWGERMCLSVPLRVRGACKGILEVFENRRDRHFNEEELGFASGLAELAAAAISNAQLRRHLEERNRRLTSLVEASAAITSTVVLEDVLAEVAQQAARALGAPQCLIWEYVADRDGLVERAYYSDDSADDFEPRKFLTLAQDPVNRDILAGGVAVQESISDPDLDPDSKASMEQWNEKTCLSVPLVFRDEPVGMLILCEVHEERSYSADERELATALGKVASSAIHHAKQFRRQEEQTRRLSSLLDAGRATTSSLVLADVLTTVAGKTAEALGASICAIWEYDAARDALVERAGFGYENTGEVWPLAEHPTERAMLLGHEAVVETISDPDISPASRRSMESEGEKTCLSVPLRFGDAALGLLVVIEMDRERVFSAEEFELAGGLAEQAAAALHNASLFERLELNSHEATLLNDIAQRAATSLNLRDIAAATLDELRRLKGFDRAVMLTLEANGALEVVFTSGDRQRLAGTMVDQLDEGFLERLQERKVLFLDLPGDSPLAAGHAVLRDLGSAAVIALFEEGRVVGVLALGSEATHAFGEADRRVFEGVGAHLSLAVKNARLYASIKQLHVGSLRALSSALNAKDYYTLGHTARVATYAGLLALELGWPQEIVDRVEEVAYLHDIGKISVSDRILLKPSRLSAEDWRLMREHPAVSAEILQPLIEERFVAGVRYHHEHYDGSGYPDGLAGDAIPELARLLCVVDSYDAMSSRRLYRPPFTYPECVAELQRCRGGQFDPRMVDAFVRVLDRLWAIRQLAMRAAEAAALRIDADSHMLLRQPGDELRPEYAQIAAILREVRDAHPGIPSMSTEVRLDEHRMMLVVDCQEDPELHVALGETSLADEEQTQAFGGHRLDANVVFVDAQGAWVSGIAPVTNSAGRIVALVSADCPAMAATEPAGKTARTFSALVQSATSRLTRLEIEAMTDFLSGLYNHRYLQDRLRQEVESTLDDGGEMSLLFCDIDKFKEYNDRFGHTAGDAALRAVAQIIDGSIRTADVAARYGGDEFAVILVGTGANIALEVAERIRESVSQVRLEEDGARVSVSIGVATLPQDGETKEQLVERADWAMYLAKHRGRDQVVRFRAGAGTKAAPAAAPGSAALQFMGAMAGVADTRQLYAERHSEAVARLAKAIAADLGLPAAEMSAVEEAARLRDIGQFAVLEEVLSKPGRLTEAEWQMVRQHPVVGERLLRALHADDAVADAVAYHHERYDGAGYPAGLAGAKIPMAARIISAACAYEAMVVPRPYREARSEAEALEELQRCAGSQFDPEVVSCLQRVLGEA